MHELMRIAMVAAGLLPVMVVAGLVGCDACVSVARHHRHGTPVGRPRPGEQLAAAECRRDLVSAARAASDR